MEPSKDKPTKRGAEEKLFHPDDTDLIIKSAAGMPPRNITRAIREAEAEAMAFKANRLRRINDLHSRLEDLAEAYQALVKEAERLRSTLGQIPITIEKRIVEIAIHISHGLQILTRNRNGG